MLCFSVLIIILIFSVASSNSLNLEDASLFKSTVESITIDLKDGSIPWCSAKKCIPKCCPKGEYIIEIAQFTYSCISYEKDLKFDNVSLYDNKHYDVKLDLKFRDIFLLVPNKFADVNFSNQYPISFTNPTIGMRNHLTLVSLVLILRFLIYFI